MYSLSIEIILMIIVVTLIIGLLIGALISRKVWPQFQQKDIEKALDKNRREFEEYQQDVSKHFAETSKLIGNLTQSYREVHEHLARNAARLTGPEMGKTMLEAGSVASKADKPELERHSIDETVGPPKDWAPKKPGEAGMLSEEFGLSETGEDQNIASLTAQGGHPDLAKTKSTY